MFSWQWGGFSWAPLYHGYRLQAWLRVLTHRGGGLGPRTCRVIARQAPGHGAHFPSNTSRHGSHPLLFSCDFKTRHIIFSAGGDPGIPLPMSALLCTHRGHTKASFLAESNSRLQLEWEAVGANPRPRTRGWTLSMLAEEPTACQRPHWSLYVHFIAFDLPSSPTK